MATNKNGSRQRSKAPRQRRSDEDEHPVEGYRDGSVYEEETYQAPPLVKKRSQPNKARTNGGHGRSDQTRETQAAKKRT